jgi:hypothetical protein
VDLDEILNGDDDVEDDIDSILLNLVASNLPKLRTYKLLCLLQILKCLVDLDEISYGVMALNITSTTYYSIP